MKYLRKFVVILILLVIGSGNLSAFAQEDVAQGDFPEPLEEELKKLKLSILKASLGECQEKLVPIYDIEIMKFMKFLETNFQNKSSTSSLVNIAIARFSQYKRVLESEFAMLAPKYSTSEGVKEYETEFAAYGRCKEITELYTNLAKEHMVRHIKNTSAQKKTTLLLEKFKAINSKLRDLNMEIAEMYSFFMTLRNKLPGFLKECL